MDRYFQGFSPQHDRYRRMRRRFPSPMQERTIDRATERLTLSAWALSDLPIARLVHIYRHADLSQSEYFAVGDALRRRTAHATHEGDAALLHALVAAKVVTL
jgi:hypothetical protein